MEIFRTVTRYNFLLFSFLPYYYRITLINPVVRGLAVFPQKLATVKSTPGLTISMCCAVTIIKTQPCLFKTGRRAAGYCSRGSRCGPCRSGPALAEWLVWHRLIILC